MSVVTIAYWYILASLPYPILPFLEITMRYFLGTMRRGVGRLVLITALGFLAPSIARADLTHAFCAAQKLPGGCLNTLGARCNKLDCYIENNGPDRSDSREEFQLLNCEFQPQCEYRGPKKKNDKKTASPGMLVKPTPRCSPSYRGPGVCVPIASDVDCAGGCGDGPAYVKGPFKYKGTDIYGIDSDGNRIACERPCKEGGRRSLRRDN